MVVFVRVGSGRGVSQKCRMRSVVTHSRTHSLTRARAHARAPTRWWPLRSANDDDDDDDDEPARVQLRSSSLYSCSSTTNFRESTLGPGLRPWIEFTRLWVLFRCLLEEGDAFGDDLLVMASSMRAMSSSSSVTSARAWLSRSRTAAVGDAASKTGGRAMPRSDDDGVGDPDGDRSESDPTAGRRDGSVASSAGRDCRASSSNTALWWYARW